MTAQPDEALVQQLTEVLDIAYEVAPPGNILSHEAARAVLASGLVIPADPIKNLLELWENEAANDDALNNTEYSMLLGCADQLRNAINDNN